MTTTTKKTFEQAYADAVIPDMTREQFEMASEERQLDWRGERMSLANAAKLYAKIRDGYNDFEPNMLAMLQGGFPHAGIEVTPAREGSVAVYLHIPKCTATDMRYMIRQYVEQHFKATEVDVVTEFPCLEGETELVGEALRIWWD